MRSNVLIVLAIFGEEKMGYKRHNKWVVLFIVLYGY